MNEMFYKMAKVSGWDFYTGKTINYRENVGRIVKLPYPVVGEPLLCSPNVIHASRHPAQCFVGGSMPCSLYKVEGTPLLEDSHKAGFKQLKILEEVEEKDFDEVFGFKYHEALDPLDPRTIDPPAIGEEEIQLLRKWTSIWTSIRDSIWDSIGDSIRASIGASENAYIGSLFPNIVKWKYVQHLAGEYPFQPCVDLLRKGLIPICHSNKWRLIAAKTMKEVYVE